LRIVMKILGERDDEHDLHELAWLKREDAEGYPPRRAPNVAAEQKNKHQKHHTDTVDGPREAFVVSIVDNCHEDHDAGAEGEPIDLLYVDVGANHPARGRRA